MYFSTRLAVRYNMLRAFCRETYHIEGVLSTFFTKEKHLQEVLKARMDMFRM